MKYTVRIDVLGVGPTPGQKKEIQDFVNSRTDVTLDKFTVKGDLIRSRIIVNTACELNALSHGVDIVLGALFLIVGTSDEMPSVNAFVEGPT